jgi:hypothetical protein
VQEEGMAITIEDKSTECEKFGLIFALVFS